MDEQRADLEATPPGMLRLFYALMVPPGPAAAIGELVGRLERTRARVSWVTPQNLHFTLKFLGDVPEPLLPALAEVGQEAAQASGRVALELTGLGAFPNTRSPRVLWVGTGEGAPSLVALANAVSRGLQARRLWLGDSKPFAAHCTLGRVKDGRNIQDLTAALAREAAFGAGWLEAVEFHLMKSDLSREGAVYTPLMTFPLLPSSKV